MGVNKDIAARIIGLRLGIEGGGALYYGWSRYAVRRYGAPANSIRNGRVILDSPEIPVKAHHTNRQSIMAKGKT
jgi:hypothetical protein